MDESLKSVHENMIRLGLGALAHANWHAQYYSHENEMWSELSVIQAAHAAEILIKARISQEHPLLIFEQMPKSNMNEGSPLNYQQLVEHGRTYQFFDLPDRLWATTGIVLPNIQQYRDFGRLRNAIQHFSAPQHVDLSQETLEFNFGVIDAFINTCWGLCAIDFNEDHEEYVYFVPGILQRGIYFNVSNKSVRDLQYMDISWPDDPVFRKEMEDRFSKAARGDDGANQAQT